jgi:gluconokinase
MGPAGAGRSRIGTELAAALALEFLEGDAFHPLENVAQMAAGIPLTDDTRRPWLLALSARLREARASGTGVVLACSALKRSYRDLLRDGDETIHFILLTGDTALLRTRLEARTGHYMPPTLLDSQLATLELPDADERAWTFDARESPDMIISSIVALLARDGGGTNG